jgi:hypothetical protein
MADEKFPVESCSWPPSSADHGERWLFALEKQGPDNVRARLALTQAAPRAAIAIGTEADVTAGFAQEWLAWKDKRKAEREDELKTRQIFWTRFAAIAASVAATAGAIGWMWTICCKAG